ncbi:MAG: HAD-IIIA family hydrolase [Rhodovulum sp.]|nr:HAD-IIIA family hydrolase [Rhodovulum sp.]
MQAIIVAGGAPAGRMPGGSASDAAVAALLRPVAGEPVLLHQVRALARMGIGRVGLLAPEPAEAARLVATVADRARTLGVAVDPVPAAGQMPADAAILVVDGPVLFDLALGPVRDTHAAHAAVLTAIVQPVARPSDSDLVAERDGRLVAVFPHDRPDPQDQRNLASSGLWLARPDLVDRLRLPGHRPDLLRDVVPALLAAGETIACHPTTEYVRRLDGPADVAAAEADLAAGRPAGLGREHPRPALLVDIDGVLNHEPGPQGTLSPDDLVMVDGAGAALARARAAGFLVVAITNRAQVARGTVSLDQLDRILGRLEARLAEDGGLLDRIYVCPHHPGPLPYGVPELTIRCDCRKPGTLLFRRALTELPIDPARAWMIGDSGRDMAAAHAMGLRAYGVATGHGCRGTGKIAGDVPDRMFADIGAAVDFVLAEDAARR